MALTIAVFGATGNQGGSVVRSLVRNPSFHVRAITRNPSSSTSTSLSALGAEVVRGDGFNREEMLAAFRGAWGAFVNTNSDDKRWKMDTSTTEFDLGRVIVEAAADAGVQHLVLSSGPPCVEMTQGKVRMEAMEQKYQIEQYAKGLEKFATVAAINAAWYLENFLGPETAPIFGGFPYFRDDEGYLTFRVPEWGGGEPVPFLGIQDDFGDIVHGIFLNPTQFNNRVIHGASALRSFDELMTDFQAATGHKARFEPILPSWEAFNTHGIAELDDVKLMFAFTQCTNGRYFGVEPSEVETAAKLKCATAVTLGMERKQLISPQEWFGKHFCE